MCSKLSVDQLYFFQVRADEHVPRRVLLEIAYQKNQILNNWIMEVLSISKIKYQNHNNSNKYGFIRSQIGIFY
jgi:hypothetical protein